MALYPDAVGREQARADGGTNGGSSFTRPATIPARSDTVLVSSTEIDSSGNAFKTIDPAATETREEFDNLGRRTKLIENWKASPSGADQNRTTEFAYNSDGKLKALTAKNTSTGDQVTKYVYGTTLTDSGIARSDLLRAEIYPDSDDVDSPLGNGTDGIYDRIELKYNRQGEVTERKDQLETTHAFEYDKLGRQTHDRVTNLGSGVDGAVKRISKSYEVRGMVSKITSYDNATVGSGSVVNEVEFEFDSFGINYLMIGFVLFTLSIVIAGCARVKSPTAVKSRSLSSTGISGIEAERLAINELGFVPGAKNKFRVLSKLVNDKWFVAIVYLPETPGSSTLVVVSSDGVVESVHNGH